MPHEITGEVIPKGKFYEYFKETQMFFDGELAISAELFTKEEAYAAFVHDARFKGRLEDIEEEFVHWHIEYYDGESKPAWWTGAKGKKGARKIWYAFK